MRVLLGPLAALACIVSSAAITANGAAAESPLALRAQMLRLVEVDWRLRLAAGPHCPRMASGIGVALDHATAYREADRAELTRTLRLAALPQVAAVAAGSAAALAGIQPGDEIVAIGASDMAKALDQSTDPALFAEEASDVIAALPPGNPATLVLRRGRMTLRKTVVPIPICASRTMLDTGRSLDAYTDTRDLAVTSALIDFAESDDELALIVGHELAHVIRQGQPGAPMAGTSGVEADADMLGAALAHCAGYDSARGAAFWPRYRQQDADARLRLPSHPSPDRREESIRAAIPRFTCPFIPWASSPKQ